MWKYCNLVYSLGSPWRMAIFFDVDALSDGASLDWSAADEVNEYESKENMLQNVRFKNAALSSDGWELVQVINGTYLFQRLK